VPVLSANGQKAAVDRLDPELGTRDAWVIDVARGYETRLTTHPANDFAPLLSPDGTRVVFASDRAGPQAALYLKSASGDGAEELIVEAGGDKRPYDWSRDGTRLLFGDSHATWMLPMSGPGERKPVRVTPPGATREWHPRLSPDGQWIVFDTSESGRWEVYVRRFPSGGEKWRVSTDGGWDPRWHANGLEIFYLNPEGTLMVVPVKAGTSFEAGISRPLFATPLKGRVEASYYSRSTYAVAPDGQRFLFTQRVAGSNATPIMVVLGWDAAAKR
jgi:Tol biopolymer transport system component